MSENYRLQRFQCEWPWTTAVVLCDGRVVCGCADPYAQRVLGDLRTQSLEEIWNGKIIQRLRRDLNRGGSGFCGDCPLKRPLDEAAGPPQRATIIEPTPSRVYIETTAGCNISCLQACCAPETGITRTRQAGMLDFDLFRKTVDQAGPKAVRIDFFVYGEPFLHRRAVEMCEYIKRQYPHVYLYTSTNGLMLTPDRIAALVDSQIDEVTFSVDGASQATYVQYRQRGDFNRLLEIMRQTVAARNAAGRDVPFLNWRYILFKWNDSDEEMTRARTLAAEIGIDRLTWEVTDHPEDSFSRRFAPGTPDHARIRHEIWDDNNLGNAIPGKMPHAEISIPRRLPLVVPRGRTTTLPVSVTNRSTARWWARTTFGRRLVRVGAQLCQADGTLLNRDYARAWLPHHVEGGESAAVQFALHAPDRSGAYRLKFDLVSEGIDWFERCGSPTITRPLYVI